MLQGLIGGTVGKWQRATSLERRDASLARQRSTVPKEI